MNKRAPFKEPKWKLSSQMGSGAYRKIITRTFLKKNNNKIQELRNPEFLMKLKFPI